MTTPYNPNANNTLFASKYDTNYYLTGDYTGNTPITPGPYLSSSQNGTFTFTTVIYGVTYNEKGSWYLLGPYLTIRGTTSSAFNNAVIANTSSTIGSYTVVFNGIPNFRAGDIVLFEKISNLFNN